MIIKKACGKSGAFFCKGCGGAMVVSKENLMKQMMKEIQSALKETDQDIVNQKLASVKTLCEVILSSGGTRVEEQSKGEITPAELKVMLGENKKAEKISYNPEQGDSIFDF